MVNRVNQQNQQTPEESKKKMKNNNNHPVGILLKHASLGIEAFFDKKRDCHRVRFS